MEQTIIKKIKKMDGTFLGIGIENTKMIETIKKMPFSEIMFLEGQNNFSSMINPKKKKKNLLKSNHHIDGKKMKEKSYLARLFEFGGKETANVKKLRKSFKKKSIDNIVCNYEYIKRFTKQFVRDSVYLNRGKIYIYGDKEDISDLVNKYKRYTDKIEEFEDGDKFLLIADNSNAKNNKIKDMGYYIVDTMSNLANIIADILIG